MNTVSHKFCNTHILLQWYSTKMCSAFQFQSAGNGKNFLLPLIAFWRQLVSAESWNVFVRSICHRCATTRSCVVTWNRRDCWCRTWPRCGQNALRRRITDRSWCTALTRQRLIRRRGQAVNHRPAAAHSSCLLQRCPPSTRTTMAQLWSAMLPDRLAGNVRWSET